MRQFYSNEVQLLISTTVVEVGVDVPNATLMIIMDADRFGLSQPHQLRGRVGRAHASYCVLVADPKSEVGQERMQVMTETEDGFEVSRRDLELRGPGDFSVRAERPAGIPAGRHGRRLQSSGGGQGDARLLSATVPSGRLLNMSHCATFAKRRRSFRAISWINNMNLLAQWTDLRHILKKVAKIYDWRCFNIELSAVRD